LLRTLLLDLCPAGKGSGISLFARAGVPLDVTVHVGFAPGDPVKQTRAGEEKQERDSNYSDKSN
jgi:hypothetical protein